MIGKMIYLRDLSPAQQAKVKAIATAENLKTGPAVVFHILERYQDIVNERDRLLRFNERKTLKIEVLQVEIERLKNLKI